ncbi:hypothetical protein EAI_01477, partial [Harpegnathos saltator]
VAASMLQAAMKILGFSVRSKNLKGTYVKVLWDATAAISAGTTLMAKRMAMSDSGEQQVILEELHIANAQLRTSQEVMCKRMEELE